MAARHSKRFIWVLVPLLTIGLLWMMTRKKNSIDAIIKETLTRAGYSQRMADMVVAVSKHETGNFTSSLSRRAKNLFGMMQPRRRPTLSIGVTEASEGQFATFKSYEDAAKDFVLYLQNMKYPKDFADVDSLVSFMRSKGYFTDTLSNYLTGVKRWM